MFKRILLKYCGQITLHGIVFGFGFMNSRKITIKKEQKKAKIDKSIKNAIITALGVFDVSNSGV